MRPREIVALKDTVPLQGRLTPKTADKHFNYLEQYWTYLVNHGKIAKDRDNPFKGFRGKRRRGRAARCEREMWSEEEIEQLLATPLFTGCASASRRSQPGRLILRDARFWVPILGILTGARENEICGAKVGDVRFVPVPDETSIPVLAIRGSKTEGSERDLPLPDALLRLGFLEYRVHGRGADEPLFPELLPDPQTGKRAPAFSGWFTRYRKEVGLYRPKLDFHSLRASFSTAITNIKGMNSAFADELTGHESIIRRSERDRYSKLIYAQNLKDAIESVPVPNGLAPLAYVGEQDVAAPAATTIIDEARARAEREKRKAQARPRQTAPWRRAKK